MTKTAVTKKLCPVKGCTAQIHNKILMCPAHWRLVPRKMRSEVWRWYRPGQEKTGMPTPMYMDAARDAIAATEKEERIALAAGIQIQQNLL